jgi:hypothetical protein
MISGSKLIEAMLNELRCTRRVGSASMISMAARSASGMYIMSMNVPGLRGHLNFSPFTAE